jgi:TonB family protein
MRIWILIFTGLLFHNYGFAQSMDIPPEPIGGNKEAKRILQSAFCPSNVEPEKRIPGKITLTFIVHKDGSVDSLSFAKLVNDQVDMEIARIFPMIQWLPGMIENKAVSAWHLFEFRVNQKFYRDSTLCMDNIQKKVYTYEKTDVQPDFVGEDFDKWVYKQLTFPDFAFKNNIEGTVVTRFIVEPNGELSNVGIKNSVGGGCDEEALRVIRMSKWKPGLINLKPVRTQIFYPITFQAGKSRNTPVGSGDMLVR